MIYEKYRNTRIKEPLFLFNIEAEAFFLNISLISEYTDLLQRNGSLLFSVIIINVYSVMSDLLQELMRGSDKVKFEVIENQFYKDGKPIKIISGAVHYFRNMPDTWSDIFKKMRAMGCNCVETYCVWNMHEKVPGEYDFSGMLNIAEFIKKADKEGLMVIVRPGPYICAEWEFGGLPWWIQNEEDIEIRCSNAAYIHHFERYLDRLFDEALY